MSAVCAHRGDSGIGTVVERGERDIEIEVPSGLWLVPPDVLFRPPCESDPAIGAKVLVCQDERVLRQSCTSIGGLGWNDRMAQMAGKAGIVRSLSKIDAVPCVKVEVTGDGGTTMTYTVPRFMLWEDVAA